ncbi:MAG: O-antigen ligase family protein [bacterium]|nr:O-antigen ligase family protein [bacterium]
MQTRPSPNPSILLFAFLSIAVLAIAAAAWPPYSAAVILGGALGLVCLAARPDLAFALFFAAESLFSEDILLITEKLEVTIYRIPLPYIGLNIFEVILVVLVLFTLLHRKGKLTATRLDFSMALFGFACLLGYATCIVLYHEPTRIFEPRRLLHFFVAFFLTVNLLQTKESLRTFLTIYFAAIVLKAIEGVFLYTMGEGLQIKWQIRAIFTGWEDSLNFVTYLLLLTVFILDRQPLPGKRGFLLALPAVFFSFLFSYKRAYYVALLAGLAGVFWLQGPKARGRFVRLCLLGLVLILGLVIAAGQWNAISMRVDSILHPTKESSANYRLIEWTNAMISINKNPLLGIGLGGVMPMEVYLSRTNMLGVHNTFLWVTVKMGLLGIFSYFLLHFAFWRILTLHSQFLRDPFLRTLSRGLTCVFLAFCAAQLFAPMFAQMRTATWFGIVLGIGTRLTDYDKDSSSTRKEEIPIMADQNETANHALSKSPNTILP